ncbi:MAG: UpxY family transcription antiterminator [Marinilabiliaceae bacterium]|nr:UpxY family transcription antiterminator [Marinilabiliaceae bacterium]
MDTTDIQKWFALYTKPKSEKKIFSELTESGIEAYLPLRKELRLWSDRKKWIDVPIISSYIFVRVSQLEYRKVFEVKNIVGYVSYKGKAVVIPDMEMEIMKRAVENKLEFSVEKGKLQKGKKIKFTSGPFMGLSGEITEIKGVKKLYLRIKNVGFTLIANIDDQFLSD